MKPDRSDKNSKKDKGNIYDRIFKENAESIFMPLIKNYLALDIKSYEPIEAKLTKTVEREVDFLYQVQTNSEETFLLHIEFQRKDLRTMIYRMAEYHGLLFRKHKLPILHVVIYLGRGRAKMRHQLRESEKFTGFQLINLYDFDTKELLASDVPEIIQLALLSGYYTEQTEQVLRLIVGRLQSVCTSELELFRYLNQLTLLSRIQSVEELTSNIIQDMVLNYDITKDSLYLKGMNKGVQQGIDIGLQQGLQKGIQQGIQQGIQVLLELNLLTFKQIAEKMNVSIAFVKKVAQEFKDGQEKQ